VDRVSLVGELERRAAAAGRRLDVLVEVNVGGELSKGGCAQEQLGQLLDVVSRQPHLAAKGLMAIPPPEVGSRRVRAHLALLRSLLERYGGGMTELSMGMSDDFELAVEEGATIVRVGTAIFGPRPG